MNKNKQHTTCVARYRKTKSYKRDMARALLGKPIRAFIALRDKRGGYIENPVVSDLQQPHLS